MAVAEAMKHYSRGNVAKIVLALLDEKAKTVKSFDNLNQIPPKIQNQ